MSDAVTGGCLCGAYRYQLDRSQVLSAHHCHCRDCQKSTGSGKATIVLAPEAAIAAEGELSTFTVTGSDGASVARGFCPKCGSPVLSFIEEMPQLRMIKAGSLDDSSWISVDSSFWSETAACWSPVDDSSPSFSRNPPMG